MPLPKFLRKLSLSKQPKTDHNSNIFEDPLATTISIKYTESNTNSRGSNASSGFFSGCSSRANSTSSQIIHEDLLQREDYPIISSDSHYEQWLAVQPLSFQSRLENTPQASGYADDYVPLKFLGEGQFGAVYLVRQKNSKKQYAMKTMCKRKVLRLKLLKNVMNEKSYLYSVRNPFFVGLTQHFQSAKHLYMVMDYVEYGDLFSHMQTLRKFPEPLVKFYAAQIVLAFEYLHNLELVYRDLKPENVMVDSKGYIKLIDFGFVKRVTGRTYTLVGTPAYLAPEIILAKGYGKGIDWWTLGILIFEMMSGLFQTPFYHENQMKMYTKICAGKVFYPNSFSPDLKDLLRNLLQIYSVRRLGNSTNGSADVKDHPWFSSINWVDVFNKKMKAPWKPDAKTIANAIQQKSKNPLPRFSSREQHGPTTLNDNDNPFINF